MGPHALRREATQINSYKCCAYSQFSDMRINLSMFVNFTIHRLASLSNFVEENNPWPEGEKHAWNVPFN
jgi:hypothetical protein